MVTARRIHPIKTREVVMAKYLNFYGISSELLMRLPIEYGSVRMMTGLIKETKAFHTRQVIHLLLEYNIEFIRGKNVISEE